MYEHFHLHWSQNDQLFISIHVGKYTIPIDPYGYVFIHWIRRFAFCLWAMLAPLAVIKSLSWIPRFVRQPKHHIPWITKSLYESRESMRTHQMPPSAGNTGSLIKGLLGDDTGGVAFFVSHLLDSNEILIGEGTGFTWGRHIHLTKYVCERSTGDQ